jgi:two-component system response regulator LytT
MKVLIVEDEPLGAQILKDLLARVGESVEVVAIRDSIRSSVHFLATEAPPDLIFMDIELADGQCFEIFRQVEVRSPVIFTTTYDEYALKAFEYNSLDYLLKPINEEDLRRSLKKLNLLKQQLSGSGYGQHNWQPLLKSISETVAASEYRERFLIKQGQRYFSVPVSDIAYFYSRSGISMVRSIKGKEYLLDYTLDQLEPMLSPKSFYRLNRHVLASHSSVSQIYTWFNGKLKITLDPALDEEVIVSREKAKDFRRWMGE